MEQNIIIGEMSKELHAAKMQLNQMNRALTAAQEKADCYYRELRMLQRTADKEEDFLMGFLGRWLSEKNLAKAKNMLRFYKPEQRIQLIIAILNYVTMGDRPRLGMAVQKVHFEIICEAIDEDAILLPAHSYMMKLMRKYGLFMTITN